jgi:CBS domain-containing protein
MPAAKIGSSPVRDYMSRGLVVARMEMPLPDLRRLLEERDISAVPVVDDAGKLRGIVSMTDLLHGPRGEGEPDAMPVASDVMVPQVLTIDEGERMCDAAARMVEKQIHRLVVLREEALVGILSTRDAARAVLATRNETPLREKMTSPVLTIEVGQSIHAAIGLLAAAGVRGLVVLDGRHPVGVFTQLEAVKARGLSEDLQRMPVEEVMSYETICLDVSTPLYRVAGYMVQMRVRRVLAVEHHALRGILSGFDLLGTITAAG